MTVTDALVQFGTVFLGAFLAFGLENTQSLLEVRRPPQNGDKTPNSGF